MIESKQIFEQEAFPLMDSLFNAALKLTYNRDDANDLVQDTYFKAYKYYKQFKQGTSLKAWMFSILKNTFINIYRKKSKQPAMMDYDEVAPYINILKADSSSIDPQDITSYFEGELNDEINNALEKLSTDFRLVLILSDIEGFAYREIADILGIPIGTVRSRLFRARKAIFLELKEYAGKMGFKINDDNALNN